MATNLLPPDDNLSDLGSAAKRWKDLNAVSLSDNGSTVLVADLANAIAAGSFAGWGFYTDDEVATQTITTTASKLIINGLGTSTNTDYLPAEILGVGELWDTVNNKITPIGLGDGYTLRIDIEITAEGANPSEMVAQFDIGGGATPTTVIVERLITTGKNLPYTISMGFPYFTLATFIANGAQIFLNTDTGTVTLGKKQISIHRISKGV